MRRIVTGETSEGKSFIVSDGPPPRLDHFKSIPGFVSALVWASDASGNSCPTGADLTVAATSFVPAAGGTRLIEMVFPPDAVRETPGFDFSAFGAEFLIAMPGLAEIFEPSGMHSTPTIDYAIVIDGELTLETDDGALTRVRAGDVVVQNGTRHAWRNQSSKPATVIIALIGV